MGGVGEECLVSKDSPNSKKNYRLENAFSFVVSKLGGFLIIDDYRLDRRDCATWLVSRGVQNGWKL